MIKPTNTVASGKSSKIPLGIRNNNPLNIRVSSSLWQGKIPTSNGFENFRELKYGIRAGIKNLLTYYDVHKRQSVSKIIGSWAPPSENNTNSYTNQVAKSIGVSPTAVLKRDKETFANLFVVMSAVENGVSYTIPKATVLATISEFNLL